MSAVAHKLPANAAQAAIGTVLNIMDKWSCSEKEKMALLGIGRQLCINIKSRLLVRG